MRKIFTLFALGVAAVLSLGTSALAQNAKEVVADIPFNFTVGQQHFAAGTYYLHLAGDRLQIRDEQGRNLALLPAARDSKLNAYGDNAVRFLKEAGQYEFAGVQTAGSDYEWQLANKVHHTHVEAFEVVKGK